MENFALNGQAFYMLVHVYMGACDGVLGPYCLRDYKSHFVE